MSPRSNRKPAFGLYSGQTTGHSREHARDLSTSGQFPSSSHKIPRSTSATRTISVLSSIILPLQTFFSRVLLLRQHPFSSENLPPERPTTTFAIKTQVFMFRYESVNSTRKFTIVAEIVSLVKKIYKGDAPFRAVFKVKSLAVLFLAYPREMKHIPQNLNLPPFWRCLFLWKWCNPFPRARAWLKHAHSFDRCGHLVNFKKHVTSMSCRLEPAIWSCDTGQQIPCFDRCQLLITWMSNIKEVHGKPRLHVSINLIFNNYSLRSGEVNIHHFH